MTNQATSETLTSELPLVVCELLQDSLRTLLSVTAALAWLWASTVLLVDHPKAPYAYSELVLMGIIVALGFMLSKQRPHLALVLYLVGLAAAVTLTVWVFNNPVMLCLYMLVVLITAMLTNTLAAWGAALGSIALILGIGLWGHANQASDLLPPIVLVLLTALFSWLSSRRLFTALAWTLNMTAEAQKNALRARQHRAQLRQALKSLDEAYVRLERANEALIVAQQAAQRAYRFKADFVANVSHELRTPLNLITGFATMIITAPEGYGATLPPEFRGDLMAIHRSAQHLSDLIDDVLDLSRIESGRMPLIREASDVRRVINEAANMVRGLVEARGLRLEVEIPDGMPPVWIDCTRIRQVLLNLLTNAARFTDQGYIRIETTVGQTEIVVAVTDSGRGIPPERIAHAFEAFSQLDDDQVRQGSGLGLAVSKRFVEMHGGRMWIESRIPHGTTVGLSLPLSRDGAPGLSSGPRPLVRTLKGPPLVLVLHDDPRILPLLRRHLEGYRFALAETPAKASEAIRDCFPAALLVDSDAAGEAAIGEIEASPYLPVVACPLHSMCRGGALVSATEYLTKPVSREDLQGVLARLDVKPQTVLVADDDPHMVRLLARMLKADLPGIKVLRAFGGQEAFEIIRSERPDLVLLDLVMPEVSGYEVMARLSQDPALADTVVVIISAHAIEADAPHLQGQLRMARDRGFALDTILQLLRATLPELIALAAENPDIVAASSAERPVPGAW